MPAGKFTKRATTKAKKRQWEHVYQSMKASGHDKAAAIRAASAALRDHPTHKRS